MFALLLCMGSQALTLPHGSLSTEQLLCYAQIVSVAPGQGEMEMWKGRVLLLTVSADRFNYMFILELNFQKGHIILRVQFERFQAFFFYSEVNQCSLFLHITSGSLGAQPIPLLFIQNIIYA